jgi:hypothetical protein
MIGLQMFASRMDQQKPVVVLGKDRCMLMQQVPPDVIKVRRSFWAINAHRKIAAAFGGAVIAKNLALF